MFEFHGWAVIRGDERSWRDPRYITDEQAFEFAAEVVAGMRDQISLIEVTGGGNGLAVLRLNGLRNHRRDNALEIFRRIGSALPQSYGLLYVFNPEDDVDSENFRVFRMARGKVEEFADSLLSPRFPTVEEPCNPDDF